MRRYTVLLIPEPEEQGYTAKVPALPGLTSCGETVPEALANAKDAIELYIADLEANGETVPEETARPQAVTIEIGGAAA